MRLRDLLAAVAERTNGQETWENASISAPVFFVNRPENFVKFLEARRPDPATSRPDPAKVKAFNDSHPDAKPQIDYLTKARGTIGLTDEELKSLPDNFLDEELRRRVGASGVAFNFKVQLAEPGDKVDDATVPLPESRKVVTAGRLVVDRVEPGAGGACDKVTFNPLVLPKGIGPSTDPVLLARPGSYAVSLGRRLPDQK